MRPRVWIIILLVGSLLATAGTRQWAMNRRAAAVRVPGQMGGGEAETTSLASMNSYALALLLGGMRGPLVMILWQQSESQKNDKNLEGVDTMIEWIRLLQPEFDTVHLFQIWNKAYNISVQMASLSNKYAVILDAIDYARRLEREKPNDINIITAIGQTYFDKLGNSAEKDYYRRRVREETRWRAPEQRGAGEVGYRNNRLEPMLDPDGNLLAPMIQPRIARPADLPAHAMWNDGAPLQYVAKYQPFPEGLSPFALAYANYKRAQALLRVGNQHHIQMSDQVVDSRPALALKAWGEEAWERGRRFELAALGMAVPTERLDMELKGADIALDAVFKSPDDAPRAIREYERAAELSRDAVAEFRFHIAQYTNNLFTYDSQIGHLSAVIALTEADATYLRAMTSADPGVRKELLAKASASYQGAIEQVERLILRYFTDERILAAILPKGTSKMSMEDMSASELNAAMARRAAYIQRVQRGNDMNAEDVAEYVRYATRAQTRLDRIARTTVEKK